MQANSITLAVDELNNGTTVNAVFTRFEETLNRSTYNSADHTLSAADKLQLYRTFPKKNGSSNGTSKCAIKFTQDVSVASAVSGENITLPLIGEVSFSVPVGVTDAQATELRQRIIALLDTDTIMDPFMLNLEI